jgi:hypothetical protein
MCTNSTRPTRAGSPTAAALPAGCQTPSGPHARRTERGAGIRVDELRRRSEVHEGSAAVGVWGAERNTVIAWHSPLGGARTERRSGGPAVLVNEAADTGLAMASWRAGSRPVFRKPCAWPDGTNTADPDLALVQIPSIKYSISPSSTRSYEGGRAGVGHRRVAVLIRGSPAGGCPDAGPPLLLDGSWVRP